MEILIAIIAILFVITILGAIILHIIQIKKSNLFTEATVIDIREVQESMKYEDHGTYRIEYYKVYNPILKFYVNGKEYIKKFDIGCKDINYYQVGQKIEVAYYEENPNDAILAETKKYYSKNKIPLIIGGILLIGYLGFVVVCCVLI